MFKGCLDDFFHVCALGANNPPSNLKLFLVFDLNVITTGQLILFDDLAIDNKIIIFVIIVDKRIPLNLFIIFIKERADFFILVGWAPLNAQF